MTTRRKAPTFDLPNLAVHALWAVWIATLIATWSSLGWPSRLGMLALGLWINFWNYAVLHNHMHLSIARPKLAHWLVSRTLGIAVGFAYRGFYLHHFNHHKYSNAPGDWGRFEEGDSVLWYSVRSTLLAWTPGSALMRHLFKATKTKKEVIEFLFDLVLIDGGIVLLIALQPSLGLSYWAVLLLGQTGIFYINYAAHDGADGTQKARLAITSTSRFYNTVFFNAGYHQAHHVRPQAPWRELPALTAALAKDGLVAQDLVTDISPTSPRWVRLLGKPRAASLAECAPQQT